MKKVAYVTFNDLYSGIYAGQVLDVCTFWKDELHVEVDLIAFISIRNFKKNKNKIKDAFPSVIVLPMFPKMKNWKWNKYLLKRKLRKLNPSLVVARGPFATELVRMTGVKTKICFDARGAYVAELNEYNVVPDENIKRTIFEIEKSAVLKSDFRIAVSQALVKYWMKEFHYNDSNHVVVPCTLNTKMFSVSGFKSRDEVRRKMNISNESVVLIYSGSSSEWHSFEAMDAKMNQLLSQIKNLEIILLTKPFSKQLLIQKNFSDRVKQLWVPPSEVNEILQMADYGWLVRENSVTNQVASPVKFAEYLFAGLKIIISDNLGDYSDFVINNQAGFILLNESTQQLSIVPENEKARMHQLALTHFAKKNFESSYKKIFSS